MKKALLLFVILFNFSFCHAQNYQCLQAGVKHYFINGNGYLRGIRIDSARTLGSSTLYYPFHTARGDYLHALLDSNGGSWLGTRVEQLANGTFLFDNIWQDTVTIRTQAHVGDSWIFYNDTTTHYYTASLISEDTMTVLGIIDSVKTIRINAYGSSGPDIADPVNNFQIVLSKNNGFVKIFDLYTFPYHHPGTAYYPHIDTGIDYYLAYVIGLFGFTGPYYPTLANSTFSLVQLINPTYAQLYDWNIGDVFEYHRFDAFYPSYGVHPYSYYFDSIINKTIVSGGIQYDFSGWKATQHSSASSHNPSTRYPYDTATTTGTFTISNDLLLDTILMPEEKNQTYIQFYFPGDTQYCVQSDFYKLVLSYLVNGVYIGFGESSYPSSRSYKTGIGIIQSRSDIFGGSPPMYVDTTLLYYVKGGHPCGHYTDPYPIYYISRVNEFYKMQFSIAPNHATTQLTIKTTTTLPYTITLQNMMGQAVQTIHSAKQEQTINVSNVPAGVYNVSITDENGNRYNEKVVIIH